MSEFWKCPHCREDTRTERRADSDKFDWTFESGEQIKELWQCIDCGGYFFMYYKFEKSVPLKEE
jgi:hypothetical protein